MKERHDPKSIGQIINDQCAKWEARSRMSQELPKEEIYRPVLLFSGQAGTMAGTVAKRLSVELDMDFFDEEIIHAIAKEAHLSERVVRTMDERGWTYAEEILNRLMGKEGLSAEAYFRHLVRVIVAIGRHGNSIVMGHGAAYILRAPMNLHVRFVASPSVRVRRLSEELGISAEEAKRRVKILDQERKEFVHQYFHADIDDDRYFDLVINTGLIDADVAVRVVKDAFLGKNWRWSNRKWKSKERQIGEKEAPTHVVSR